MYFAFLHLGSLETLKVVPAEKGIDIRELLMKFHSKYYSSNIMSVAVLGKGTLFESSVFFYFSWEILNFIFMIINIEIFNYHWLHIIFPESLDELEAMVVPKFKDILDKGAETPTFPDHPLGPNQLGVRIICNKITVQLQR